MKNRIREFRLGRGWSQQYLADQVGTVQPQIDRWEKNQRRVSDFWIEKIAVAFGCDPVDLWEMQKKHRDVDDEWRESERAILFALKLIIQEMSRRDPQISKEIERNLNFALGQFQVRHLDGAARLTDELRRFVAGETPPSERELARKFLELVPLGSA